MCVCSICSISSEWNTLTWDSSSFWTPSTLGNLADLPIPGGFSSTRQSSSRVWQHYYQTGTILCLVPSIGLFLSRASGFQEVTWKIQNCNSHLPHLLQRYLFMHVYIYKVYNMYILIYILIYIVTKSYLKIWLIYVYKWIFLWFYG